MSKKINLTFSERLIAVRMFNDFQGTFTQAAVLNKDVPAFAISKAELEAAPEYKAIELGDGQTQFTWKDEKTGKALELQDETIDYLKEKIGSYAKFQINDAPVVEALKAKLQ